MTASELKPCPFCGGDKNTICKTDYDGGDSYAVSCRYPECHGAIFTLGYGYFATKAEAIAAWNTRTDLSQAAIARAEKAEADRDEWRKTAITKIEMADSTALRDKDATITTLQARVRELESVFSHLYGQAVWLRGDQAYRDFARAFIKRMSALRIKCVSRQELAKIEGKTE